MQLTIRIADANIIQINQGNFAYAGARQSFSSPATDTTNAHYTDMSLLKGIQGFAAI
jgi:hypothetical protein